MAAPWSRAPKLALWKGEAEGQGRAYIDPTDDIKAKLRYPSVTTVLKMEDKSDLVSWATRKVAEMAVERYADLGQDPEWVLMWLPYAHNDFRDRRGWVGSGVHARIQSDLENTWDYPELDEEQERIMDRWAEFNLAYEVEPLGVERTVKGVTRDGHEFMGTYDLLAKITDRLTGESWIALIDFKTSRNLWPTHEKQLAALKFAQWEFIEVDKDTEGAYLRKWKNDDGKMENSYWIKRPAQQVDKVQLLHLREDKWDLVDIEPDILDLRWSQFQSYLQIWDDEAKVKELKKSGT